jgi:predicted dehydrogenase
MLATSELDGVILAVPPQVQRRITESCIAARTPVLVEKPLATRLEDAERMAQAARDAASLVMVDHTHVFSAAFERLRAIVGMGPLSIRSEGGNWGPFDRPIDGVWDYGPHDVAMCLEVTGTTPQALRINRRREGSGGSLLVEMSLWFPHGHNATITVGNLMRQKRRLFEVDDGRRVLIYDDLAPHKLIERREGGMDVAIAVDDKPPLTRVVEAFVSSVRSGYCSHPSLPLAVEVVKVLAFAARTPVAGYPTPLHIP